jgi:drug/metabolite transporter (DMT)-like permease
MQPPGLDRETFVRATVAVLLVALVGVGFIVSYAGALHDPVAHEVAFRDLAYFPDAGLWGPLLCLVAWSVGGALVAVAVGSRRTDRAEAEGSMAATAAP